MSKRFFADLPRPRRSAERRDWSGLVGDSQALAIAELAVERQSPTLVVAGTPQQAAALQEAISFFLAGRAPVLGFPDWETLPYDVFSPHQDIISERLAALYRMPQLSTGVLVIPAPTMMHRLPPRGWVEGRTLFLKVGDRLDLEAMRMRLDAGGYRCVPEVNEHGEYAVRGALLDLFPMGGERPYRIDLFDDEVESIRSFDPETQRTEAKVDSIDLLPAREMPLDESGITFFRQAFRATFEGDPNRSLVYRTISEGRIPGGIEYYLPLFFEHTATMFDYLPADSLAIRLEGIDQAAESFWRQIGERFEQRQGDIERPPLSPRHLFTDPDELRSGLNRHPQIVLHSEPGRGSEAAVSALPNLSSQAQAERPLARLEQFLEEQHRSGVQVLFTAESAGRRQGLYERLQRLGIDLTSVESWADLFSAEQSADAEQTADAICVAPLERGAIINDQIALVPESALYGERARQSRRRRSSTASDPAAVIRDLSDLHEGAPVVHEDHGVGRYVGLQSLDMGGVPTEFVTLEYAGGDKLYVPVASLDRISRYTGADADEAPQHRLGSDQWDKARRRAAKRARDVAAELLEIYARRQSRSGHSCQIDQQAYEAFAEGFPFEETPDQQAAIEAVLADMHRDQPMDRVVCGDVGFGKTEVAMRAAFAGVQAGRQVAMLVPTTLLAQQHYQSFTDRFADWPIRIESLSRFSGKKGNEQALRRIAEGQSDIVIGTHKLLGKDINFHNLGLVIIDEEQRFGVSQKEKLKQLRAEVDVLTLTATPIPRTLNMSLAGIRDLSIIATPPERRLAVKTFVQEWSDGLIREACQREMQRGGQVYFLYNEVKTINRAAHDLENLMPEARIGVAHGQMRERELEQVMLDFYHQRYDILVCSTIIESGIDVPTANTIIINRADRFGLAQLHQLRGRVGRSHHRAYAYLLAPPPNVMTRDAIKRLEAISLHEDLGVGFALASHDLEIRGAGELLGDEQSGQIQEIGFTLYSQLLERAVKDMKAGETPEPEAELESGVEVDLRLPALLPADYLPDVHTRLVQYKRISSAKSTAELDELQVEMIDRFGLLPQPARNLFRVAALKQRAEQLGIAKIEAGPKGGAVQFANHPRIDAARLVSLVQNNPKTYRLEGQHRLLIHSSLGDEEERFAAIEQVLDAIACVEETA
ncbi:transcription-repair coupling factor [Halorhodospira halochloris]|uniref:Transcription-repair-coupling factor n=1 Tax=Halorhodospira halochloris TaxID=1052 RepID=A0A120MZW2_HALHR|nr:transcription-repair coupling factor [Halorhodospira halochloris]BAU57971.1 transcription-repair coupling factor [Halorhodospira halochloris]